MEAKGAGGRRRRRTTGFVPRVRGNAIFTRCLEEVERFLSPRRAGESLCKALEGVGATPETVKLGHFVRAVDTTLRPALEEHCDPEEAEEIVRELSRVLDELAGLYFTDT